MTLKIENLSKMVEEKWTFRDIAFKIERGEIFGIFGFDSQEQSTLIRVIAGFEKPNEGTIFFDGRDISNLSAAKRGFYCPQESESSFLGSIFKTAKPSNHTETPF